MTQRNLGSEPTAESAYDIEAHLNELIQQLTVAISMTEGSGLSGVLSYLQAAKHALGTGRTQQPLEATWTQSALTIELVYAASHLLGLANAALLGQQAARETIGALSERSGTPKAGDLVMLPKGFLTRQQRVGWLTKVYSGGSHCAWVTLNGQQMYGSAVGMIAVPFGHFLVNWRVVGMDPFFQPKPTDSEAL